MKDDVKLQLNRGRNFLRKYELRQYRLAYIDKRETSSKNFIPYYTLTKYDNQGHGTRLLSAYSMEELMRKFIGDNKQFWDEWRKTSNSPVKHPLLDVPYKAMRDAVAELGITRFKIKKTTDERQGIGIGRCYGFYEKIISSYIIVGRSLDITDFFRIIEEKDPELARKLEEKFQEKMNS